MEALASIPNVLVLRDEPLARHTRFGIGGPASVFVESQDTEAFAAALTAARASGLPVTVMGGGTNLIVADAGYPGIVLRFRGNRIEADGARITAEAGAELQDLVDFTIDRGARGLETLAGIPGWVGAAVYGNAGAYGHAISERVQRVRFLDGATPRVLSSEQCGFRYRESVFKRRKDWVILSAELLLEPADQDLLRTTAGGILAVRNEKFPPTMKCAGSVFKNLLLAELPAEVARQVPPEVVREGKVPAAYFLDQAGAKGMRRGGIHVASYHANLIYNAGGGTAAELRGLIGELKSRVRARFRLDLEEEVQYVG